MSRIPGTLVHRADLLLALANCVPEERERVAAHCGFGETDVAVSEPPPWPQRAGPPSSLSFVVEPPRHEPSAESAELTFLRVDFYEPIEGAEEELTTWPAEVGDEPIRPERLDARPYTLRPEPLQPWPRLWPFLHHVLGHFVSGSRIDLPRLIHDLARHRPVLNVPLQPQLAWAPQVHVLIDDGPVMSTFRDDVAWLLEQLQRMRGRDGLFRHYVRQPDELFDPSLSAATPRGQTLLVVSDLGCLDNCPGRIGAWLEFGRRLQRRGVHRFALSPCPRDRWEARLARVWNCAPWDRHDRPPRGRSGRQPLPAGDAAGPRQRLAALLVACSAALRIEAPLLRELRLLLPGADAGLEHDFRSDPAVVSVPGLSAVGPDDVQRLREELAAGSDDEWLAILKQALPDLLERHHAGHSASLRASETRNLHDAGLDVSVEEATAVSRAMVRAQHDRLHEDQDDLGLDAWTDRELARVTDAQAHANKELAAAAAYRDWKRQLQGQDVHPPANVDRTVYAAHYDHAARGERRRQTCWLCRRGDDFELARSSAPWAAGTPLGAVPMFSPRLVLDWRQTEKGKEQRRSLGLKPGDSGRSREARAARNYLAETDRCRFELNAVSVPPWATRFGWDRFGLFADFAAGGATFTLRWIPPGEFFMGSPEDEPGRWDDEGPQHRVVIRQGFWLGATPVTQGQYAAVTGERPAYFEHAGDEAPVEQVSWDDGQAFCRKLPALEVGWQFRLPSEAEWEYACRAGTTTALYTGPLTIQGECNGPELDAIAWYGGNSGVKYKGGYDSSDWPEKQYPHERAGTHPVAQKKANAWGLHDMLGNVWEWCEDTWHGSYEGAPDDGSAWVTGQGSFRVYRGGRWASGARRCRCAYRYHWRPVDRHALGFRLVLSHSSSRRPVQLS